MEEVLQNIKLNGKIKKFAKGSVKGMVFTSATVTKKRVDVSVPANPLESPSSLAL